MDRGKSKLTLEEVIHAKKQRHIPSQDALFFGGMSTTRGSNTTLNTPSLHTPLAQTPNLPVYSSHTPSSESPLFSINQGKRGSFPGLNPTKTMLAQRRRRENEQNRVVPMLSMEPIRLFSEAPSTQGDLSHQVVTQKDHSLDLPLTDIQDAFVDLPLSDIQDQYGFTKDTSPWNLTPVIRHGRVGCGALLIVGIGFSWMGAVLEFILF